MLYHYNDNENVLLLKMFQILSKYNIEFEYAPTFNERRVSAYSRGGGGGGGGDYKVLFVKRGRLFEEYRSQMRF